MSNKPKSEQAAKSAKKGVQKPSFGPKLEDFVALSKDGRWVIHKTIITSIKPVRFFEKVLGLGPPEDGAIPQSIPPEIKG